MSRFFFPTRVDGAKAQFRRLRAAKLRDLFAVGDAWVLRDRAVRDAEEHFDERFDAWQARQPVLTVEYVESSEPVRAGTPPTRLVDVATWSVQVDDASIQLVPIRDELRRIVRLCFELEPLAGLDAPQLAYGLATLPDWPAELRLDAPTWRCL
jgi:hypothetical protein